MIAAHYVRRPAEIGAAAAEHTATLEEEAAAAQPPLVAAAGGRAAATTRAQEATRARDDATLDQHPPMNRRVCVEAEHDGDATTVTAASRARHDAESNYKEASR